MRGIRTKESIKALMLGLVGVGMAMSSVTAPAATLDVEAELDRRAMSTDEAAVLTVTVSGGQQAQIELPSVDGLEYQPTGTSSNMRIVNGVVSSTISRTILVRALEPGDYTIPKIRVTEGGAEAYSAEDFQLTVTKGSGRVASPSPMGRSLSPAPAMPGGALGPASASAGRPGDLAFLEVRPAKTDLVVGEYVPVEVRAYFRSGERISLRSLPTVSGGAFTMKNQEGDARRERVMRDGVPYTMLTFYSGMTAVKPGEFPAEVTLDATVVVREQSGRNPMGQMRSRMGSMFDNSFFGDDLFDDFFGRLVEKQVALKAEPIVMNVAEVPTEGRPAGYTGAVGQFTISATASPSAVKAGDPVTLKVQVEGTGHFDRVRMPILADGTDWKTYPASEEFVGADAIGSAGVKLFEQVIVPQSPEIDVIPPLEFVYYDSAAGSFETVRTEAIPMSVSGEAVRDVASSPVASSGGPVEAAGAGLDGTPVFDGDAGGDVLVRGLNPLYGQGWFQVVMGVAWFGVIAGFISLARRRVLRDESGRLARRSMRREMAASIAEMDRAMGRQDVVAFFGTMRRAVQAHVSRVNGMDAAAVTAADVKDAETREILSVADAVEYAGGGAMGVEELANWRARAVRVLGVA
ncbi:MAG: BatD family protein [Verrucomicrobiota bacterium]